jgi:retron-type reverse transcriptase
VPLESEISKVFHEGSVSWENLIKSAASVDWADWKNRGAKSTSLINVFSKKADTLVSLAKTASRDINVVSRNAVALASEERLPIARLVLVKLLYDGQLSGPEKSWFTQLPKPTALEIFLTGFIREEFKPTPKVFCELLEFSKRGDVEGLCIQNLIHSFGTLPKRATSLFDTLSKQRVLMSINEDILFYILRELFNETNLSNDIGSGRFAKLPKKWRIAILADDDLVSLFLGGTIQERLARDPYSLPDAPAPIFEAEVRKLFLRELKSGHLNSATLAQVVNTDGILERWSENFDWSALHSIKIAPNPSFGASVGAIESIRLKERLPLFSAANISLVILVGLSGVKGRRAASYTDPCIIRKYVTSASREAVAFAVRNTRGKIQRGLIDFLRKDFPKKFEKSDIAEWFFEGDVDGTSDIELVCQFLPLASDARTKTVFSGAVAQAELSLSLLMRSEEYRSFFLGQLARGKFRDHFVTEKAFRVYGSLGEFGGKVIETFLNKPGKIVPVMPASEVFRRTLHFAPGAAVHVFQIRGLRCQQFVEMISTRMFGGLGRDLQEKIFELKTPRGKSPFQQALRRGKLSPVVLEMVEKRPRLRKFLIKYSPSSLSSKKASTSEHLAALVYTPADAAGIDEKFSKTEVLKALPKAISILGDNTRVAAALELAVRSDIRTLPVFLRLVQSLTPPYQTADLGKRFDDLYTTYELPKKSGGSRTISAPAPHLKLAQRALLKLLYAEEFSDAATGFRPGRSIRDNAVLHVGKDVVVNADIKGFFPSTTYKQVYSLSRRLVGGILTPLSARLFSEICCYKGALATGAPTSPAVSNLILKRLDDILSDIAGKLSVSYSRYADDITFSGDGAAVWMLKPLENHLTKLGYELDSKKTNIFRKGRRQTVTGAVVNQKVSLARPLRKNLRAAVHRRLNGEQPTMHGQPLSDQSLRGYLAFLSMLSPEYAKPLLVKLEALEEWQP